MSSATLLIKSQMKIGLSIYIKRCVCPSVCLCVRHVSEIWLFLMEGAYRVSTRFMLSRPSFHTCLQHHFTVRSTQRGFLSATPFSQLFGFLTWEHQPDWCSRAAFRLKSINQVDALQSIIPHMSATPFHSPLHTKEGPVCNSIFAKFDFILEGLF